MNNLQRGIYQPLADKVPIYDLADEDPEEERSRAPLLVVIALVVLAAFAGVVWLAYNQGVERGRQGASLVITAPEGPVRIAPPEATPAPFTNLNVYNDPVSPEQEAKGSALAPSPPPPPPPSPAEAPPIRLSQAVPALCACACEARPSPSPSTSGRRSTGPRSRAAAGADRSGAPASPTGCGSGRCARGREPGSVRCRRAANRRLREPGPGEWRMGGIPLPLCRSRRAGA